MKALVGFVMGVLLTVLVYQFERGSPSKSTEGVWTTPLVCYPRQGAHDTCWDGKQKRYLEEGWSSVRVNGPNGSEWFLVGWEERSPE